KFGSDPGILNQTLNLNDHLYRIVGVMPAVFQFPERGTQVWTPLAFTEQARGNHGSHYLQVVGRIKPEVTLEQAQSDLSTIAHRLQESYPNTNKGWEVKITPLLKYQVGDMAVALYALLGAVGMVLLIACANIANLMLARATARQKEISIRCALGAKRSRIVRQLLTESILLSVIGGLAGLLLAGWALDLLLAFVPKNLPRVQDVHIDGRAVGYTIAISFITGILFGLAPAIHASSTNLADSLKDNARGSTGSVHKAGIRSLLIMVELALSMMLLVGAGLMIKSFIRLTHVNPGFNPSDTLMVSINLPGSRYKDDPQQAAFFRQLLQKVSATPTVTAAGVTESLPMQNDYVNTFRIEGEPPPAPGQEHNTNYYSVSPGYFKAMGIPLVRGRLFSDNAVADNPPVVLISESLTKRYFPDQDPIGKRVSMFGYFAEVIGIVGDVKQYGLASTTPAEFYTPFDQNPFSSVTMVIRGTGDVTKLGPIVRSEVLDIDKDLPVAEIYSGNNLIANSVNRDKLTVVLLSIFGALALVLASVGIYGVMSYSVTQRVAEMGLRMALGAQASDVLKLIIGHGMILTVIGVVAGTIASFFLTGALETLLYGIHATDPVTYIEIASLLCLVAFVASFIPARRATKVDPMIALRSE
ncbi:MAG TPA: ABC transporter permease, partial [Blastocatellia bacterium]|nr:ABC transporter permease [Blastocatellia bacterium]